MNEDKKFIDIVEIYQSGIYSDDEEDIVCVKCKKVGYVVQLWNSIGDAMCENCGTYQIEFLNKNK